MNRSEFQLVQNSDSKIQNIQSFEDIIVEDTFLQKNTSKTVLGTYVHPILINSIAMWISEEFALKVADIVEEYFVLKANNNLNDLIKDYKNQLSSKDKKIDQLIKQTDSQCIKIDEQCVKIDSQCIKIDNQTQVINNQNIKIDNQTQVINSQNIKIDNQTQVINSQNIKIDNLIQLAEKQGIVLDNTNTKLDYMHKDVKTIINIGENIAKELPPTQNKKKSELLMIIKFDTVDENNIYRYMAIKRQSRSVISALNKIEKIRPYFTEIYCSELYTNTQFFHQLIDGSGNKIKEDLAKTKQISFKYSSFNLINCSEERLIYKINSLIKAKAKQYNTLGVISEYKK